MQDSFIVGLIQNISILLAFSMLYDYFWVRTVKINPLLKKIITGCVLGCVGIILILTPWTYQTGIFFDSRSIMLAVSGLFLGPIPTIIAMLFMTIYRFVLGGPGMLMGIAVIVTSGTIGLFWNVISPEWKVRKSKWELLLLGLLVHGSMLFCTLLLGADVRTNTIENIAFPVMFIYPVATVFLAKLMIRQSDNWAIKQALDVSEERWHYALDGADEGIWDWNPQTNEIFFSSKWKNMLGYDDGELANLFKVWVDLIHPDDKERVLTGMDKLISGESLSYKIEQRLLCKDNSYKWILSQGKVMKRDENNNPLRCMGTNKDISIRKEKELLLAQEKFLLESLMNFTPESVYFKDLDSRFIRVNKVLAMKLGHDSETDLIGKSDFDFFSEEFAKSTFEIEREIIKTGKTYTFEEFKKSNNGGQRWTLTNKMPLQDLDGNTVGTFGFSFDITDRKIAEKALLDSENYTNSILRAIPDLIFILDENYVFNDFKTGNRDELVLPSELFLNKSIFEVLPKALIDKVKSNIDIVLSTKSTTSFEYKLEIKGVSNDFESIMLPFGDNKVIATIRNISPRKKVESELKDSQLQLKNFAGHLQSIREEERVLLAREIHDELGQILIALKIDLGIFKQQVVKDVNEAGLDNFYSQYNAILEIVNNTIKTTRKIMTGLRPEMLDIAGFSDTAQLYVSEFSERYQIKCQFVNRISKVVLDSQQSLALFRILQEALTNIAKHSKATEVVIIIKKSEGRLNLKISDNGVGFDDKKKMRFDSYGLLGMKERVLLLNGKLNITGNLGKGAEVSVEMPYNG